MIQINLLPWREQLRQVKKNQFITLLISAVGISFLILIFFHIHYSRIANAQREINNALSSAINEEQMALNQMNSSEQGKNNIDAQLKFIIGLYEESYGAVRFLNELVTLIPDSIQLTQIKRHGREITLIGVAETEHDITQLLNDVEKSPYFNQPALSSINIENNSRKFKVMFEQKEGV